MSKTSLISHLMVNAQIKAGPQPSSPLGLITRSASNTTTFPATNFDFLTENGTLCGADLVNDRCDPALLVCTAANPSHDDIEISFKGFQISNASDIVTLCLCKCRRARKRDREFYRIREGRGASR